MKTTSHTFLFVVTLTSSALLLASPAAVPAATTETNLFERGTTLPVGQYTGRTFTLPVESGLTPLRAIHSDAVTLPPSEGLPRGQTLKAAV
jgi:hypothetical protein